MLTHTVRIDNRDPRKPELTAEEAAAMLEKGFRFSIYRPKSEGFQLSYPMQIAEDRVRGTLTFMQEGDEVLAVEGGDDALPVEVKEYFALKRAAGGAPNGPATRWDGRRGSAGEQPAYDTEVSPEQRRGDCQHGNDCSHAGPSRDLLRKPKDKGENILDAPDDTAREQECAGDQAPLGLPREQSP